MWTSVITIILGAIGWGITNLLFSPLREIVDLRRKAQEYLIIHGNISKDAPIDDRRKASEIFRQVGAGLVAHHIAAYPWVGWFYKSCLHWDIHSAGALLIGIGNSTQFEGFSFANASPNVMLVRKCLNLPVPEEPDMIRILREHASQPIIELDDDLQI